MLEKRVAVLEQLPSQQSVIDIVDEPISSNEGDRYIVSNSPISGSAFEGHEEEIAWYYNSTWYFDVPVNGWRVWIENQGIEYIYDNGWQDTSYVDTQLTQEEVQDYSAPLLDHSDHVNLSAVYNDSDNKIVLEVPNDLTDLSNYSTDNLVEGSSNLYFTDQRAIDALEPHTSDTSIHFAKGAGYVSAGVVGVTPTLTDNGDGTVTIGSTDVRLWGNSLHENTLYQYNISESTLTVVSNETNYVCVDYNSGSPQYFITTDQGLINESDIIPIWTFYAYGSQVTEQVDWNHVANGLSNKIHKRFIRTERFKKESGLSISEYGTRNIQIDSGIVWVGISVVELPTFESGVNNWILYYYNGTSWVRDETTTQYNNTQYNPDTGLDTLGNNNYVVNWVYRSISNENKAIYVLSKNQYNKLSEALNDQPRNDLPDIIDKHYFIVGRVIVEENSVASVVENVYEKGLTTSTPESHSSLTDLYGSGDLYHVSQEVYTDLHDTNAQLAALHTDGSPTFQSINISGSGSLSVGQLQQNNNELEYYNGNEWVVLSSLSYVAGAAYNTVQDYFNLQSPGRILGGQVSDNGDGTVTVTSGSGVLKSSNSCDAPTYFISWSENTSLNIDTSGVNYIGVKYNSGSPIIFSELSYDPTDCTKFYLAQAYYDNGKVHTVTNGIDVAGFENHVHIWAKGVFGDITRGYGVVLGESGTRNIQVSQGTLYAGFDKNDFSAIDTSGTDTFTYYWSDGSEGWNESYNNSQIDSLHFDDRSGTLAELTNNYFGNHWIYADFDGHIVVVYGRGDYNKFSEAEAAQPPSDLPERLTHFSIWIGQIIIEKSASSFSEVLSAFNVSKGVRSVTDHGELTGLSDDDHVQYLNLAGRSGQIIEDDITISGNLYVSGEKVQVDTRISATDNIIVTNFGEVNSGITNTYAGLEFDRGDLNPYRLVFNEGQDNTRIGVYYLTVNYTNLSGTFQFNEEVVGQSSGATGYIITDDGSGSMDLKGVEGSFDVSGTEEIVGQSSGASANVSSKSITDDTQALVTRLDSGFITDDTMALWDSANNRLKFLARSSINVGDFSGTLDDIADGTTYVRSHNDFTDTLLSKLNGIESGANNYTLETHDNTYHSEDYITSSYSHFTDYTNPHQSTLQNVTEQGNSTDYQVQFTGTNGSLSGIGIEVGYSQVSDFGFVQSNDRSAGWKPIKIRGSSISLEQGNVNITDGKVINITHAYQGQAAWSSSSLEGNTIYANDDSKGWGIGVGGSVTTIWGYDGTSINRNIDIYNDGSRTKIFGNLQVDGTGDSYVMGNLGVGTDNSNLNDKSSVKLKINGSNNQVSSSLGSGIGAGDYTVIGIGNSGQPKGGIAFENTGIGYYRGNMYILNNNDTDASTPNLSDAAITITNTKNIFQFHYGSIKTDCFRLARI